MIKTAEQQQAVRGSSQTNFHRFISSAGREYDFAVTHLIYCVLEENPERGSKGDGLPERLAVSFSTHDVKLTGRNLASVRNHLVSGKGQILQESGSPRYAELDPKSVYVGSIEITAVK